MSFQKLCLLGLVIFFIVTPVKAQTFFWTGAGNNDNWSTGANWEGGVPPTSGSGVILSFSSSELFDTANNDLGNFVLNSVQLDSPGFTISGDPLEFVNDSSGQSPSIMSFNETGPLQSVVIENDFVVTDDLSFGRDDSLADGGLLVYRGVTNGPGDILFMGAGDQAKFRRKFQLQGTFGGTGDIIVEGFYQFEVGGFEAGGEGEPALIMPGKTLIVTNSAMRLLICEIGARVELNSATVSFGFAGIAKQNIVNGDVQISGFTVFANTIDTEGGVLGAVFNGEFIILPETWVVEDGVTLLGESSVVVDEDGELEISGDYVGDTTIGPDAELSGDGSILGDVIIEGLLSPGFSAGTLEILGCVVLVKTSTTMIELGGSFSSDFDNITGGSNNQLTLGGFLNIDLIEGFIPDNSDTFAIFTGFNPTGNYSNVIGNRVFFEDGSFQIDTGEGTGPSSDVVLSNYEGILLGDLNGDGVVDLLDIPLFQEALVSFDYIVAADMNEDGFVNLSDIAGFIEALTS